MKNYKLALCVRVSTVLAACLFFFLAASPLAFAQGTHTARSLGSTPSPYGYYEYLPKEYGSSTASFPVMIFLHGNGETGDGSSQLSNVLKHGPPREVNRGRHFPMLILSPQTSSGWSNTKINEFIEYAKKKYRINPDKVYLTGLSLGGIATFSFAATYPHQLAAIVPIAGRGSASDACKYASSVPIWAFHGTSDGVIHYDGSKLPVESYNKCSPSPGTQGKLTLYSGVGHDSWTRTYDGSAGHDIYTWVLQFTKGSTKTSTTTSTSGITAPSSLAGSTGSTSVKLSWKDNSSNESEFEIWMSAGNNSSYSLRAKAGTNSTAYTVGSLTSGQTYYFKVRAKNSTSLSSFSNEISAKPGSTTTNKPPVVSAGTDKSITLPTNTLSISGTASDSDGSIASVSWSKINGPSASMSGTSSLTLGLSNLVEGTYTFRLTAKDNAGATASDDVLVYVKASTTSTSTSSLAAPSNLYAVADKSTVAKLSWKDNSSDETEFEIHMSAGNNSSYSLRAKSGANSTAYTVTNLVAGQTYYFKTRVKNSSGKFSAYSNEVKLVMVAGNTSTTTTTTNTTTTSTTSDFGAPSNLKGAADKSTAAKLSWSDNSTTETEFEIHMSVGNNSSYSLRAKAGANSTAYTVSNLQAGQTYYFRVRAKNSSGKYTAYSNEIAVKMQSTTASRSNGSDSQEGDSFYAGNESDADLKHDLLDGRLSAYPNPASTYVDIQLEASGEETTYIQLVDLSGRVRLEKSHQAGSGSSMRLELDNQNLTPGMYVLRITSGSQTRSVKLLKK
jgi:predicted esterase